jgi:gamma-glutamyltranspeptidase / glutathione hydrolase
MKAIEVTSPHAVTIPGAIDAWATILRDHGTLSLADALAPAIEAAEGGFAVAPRVSHDWAVLADKIAKHSGARKHLLLNGHTPRMGEIMRFPALAATLKQIARHGRDAFYAGDIAEDIVATLKELGGIHDMRDFESVRAEYVTPISVGYRGAELVEMPPNNQGIVALIALKMLDRLGPSDASDSADRYHLMMEVSRLAYMARDQFLADPATTHVPLDFMLSDGFISDLTRRIDRRRRTPAFGPIPHPKGTDTTYLTVVDKSGMAVSFINSLFAGFGSGIVTERTGVVLQNRGSGFVLDAAHPNCIAPGKRPLHTLVPAIAMRDGRPWISFGVMGGAFQPIGHAYVMTNRIDYGLDLQQAIDHPRVFFENDLVQAEETVPDAVMAQLTALGHPMARRVDPWGGGQAIEFDHANGCLIGASDHRKDGCALGY